MDDRLTELVIRREYGGLEEAEQEELIDSLIEELNARKDTIHELGDQLMRARAIKAKLEQKLKMKRVN